MIKPLVTHKQRSEYYSKDTYFCTVDMDQKRVKTFKGEDDKDYKLFIPVERINNHRISHPNYGLVTHNSPGSQFKVGDTLLVRHFTFEDVDRNPLVQFSKDGIDYFKATNFDVMFGIVHGEIVPREGVLLCEGIEGKLIETTLELTGEYDTRRRDVARVIKTWKGCTKYSVGDIVMLAKGGDYEFEHEGKSYLKVDHYFNDIIAVVPSDKWRVQEVRKHVKDYTQRTQI